MPEKGWTALTVRDEVGRKIKELAEKDGSTVSEYLTKLISLVEENRADHTKSVMEEWTVCRSCGTKLKTGNLVEHMSKIHKTRL